MTDDEIETLLRPALTRIFGRNGLDRLEVVSGKDHDGDPALFLTLHFGAAATLPTFDETKAAAAEVDRLLHANGDTRFAYTNFALPKDPDSARRLQSQLRDLLRA